MLTARGPSTPPVGNAPASLLSSPIQPLQWQPNVPLYYVGVITTSNFVGWLDPNLVPTTIIIIIIDSMTSVFNTDSSLPYDCTWAEMLSRRPHLDRKTVRVLNQGLWLKSLIARQRRLAGNASALPFPRNKSPNVPTPNLKDQKTVFVRPLTIDQPGMRDTLSVAGTPSSIAQWVAEVRKPSHRGKDQSLRDDDLQ
ncbi:hypothetical protein CSKR_113691 [Clonorchis sinensis]|uniref:Uncharacterized protein n=1 Tax=Clonorchis sinensis TaxID=79923 RepID=A0A419Q4C7_CLOSI|nr:hypothetical protein CSKR_113691 [Clonorchis sinensis]